MKFQSKNHRKNFLNLLVKDDTDISDNERMALFYIVAGNEDLYHKSSHIYNFKGRGIKSCLEKSTADFYSSSKALIRLAFNLYNGYTDNCTDPLRLFYNLDDKNMQLAMGAVDVRFEHSTALTIEESEENEYEQDR